MLWMCRESVTYRYWAPARARGAAWPFVRVSPEGLHGRAHVTDRHGKCTHRRPDESLCVSHHLLPGAGSMMLAQAARLPGPRSLPYPAWHPGAP